MQPFGMDPYGVRKGDVPVRGLMLKPANKRTIKRLTHKRGRRDRMDL